MKFMKWFIEEFSNKPAFGIDEVKAFLRRRNASEGYHKLLIQNMIKSGRIYKITRGVYTFLFTNNNSDSAREILR